MWVMLVKGAALYCVGFASARPLCQIARKKIGFSVASLTTPCLCCYSVHLCAPFLRMDESVPF